MKQGGFAGILARYGRDVTVYTGEVPEGVTLRAFFQPVRDRGTAQTVPSPLGIVKQDRFIYLGPPGQPLDDLCRVEVDGEVYGLEAAHPVHIGQVCSHWWAIFTRRGREVAR